MIMMNDIIKDVWKTEEKSFGCSVRTKKMPSRKTVTGQKNEEKAKQAMNTGEPHDLDSYMIPIMQKVHKPTTLMRPSYRALRDHL